MKKFWEFLNERVRPVNDLIGKTIDHGDKETSHREIMKDMVSRGHFKPGENNWTDGDVYHYHRVRAERHNRAKKLAQKYLKGVKT